MVILAHFSPNLAYFGHIWAYFSVICGKFTSFSTQIFLEFLKLKTRSLMVKMRKNCVFKS